jgi:hypothetical protein
MESKGTVQLRNKNERDFLLHHAENNVAAWRRLCIYCWTVAAKLLIDRFGR